MRSVEYMNKTQNASRAIEEAFEEFFSPLFRFCMVLTRDRDMALDIAQEAFVRTYRHMASGRQIDAIKSFLYRVARNAWIDSERVARSVSLEALCDEGFDVAGIEKTEGQARMREVLREIDSLPEIYRESVYLRYVEEYAPEEIAEMLGLDANTVSVRIHRGRALLRTNE